VSQSCFGWLQFQTHVYQPLRDYESASLDNG